MTQESTSQVTRALIDWNNGIDGAAERLIPFVYDELKRQARILMSRERSDHTLQPTALVNEAFIRLKNQTGIEWENRSHFYGIASRLMRQILVQHARRHTALKRGSGEKKISLDDVQIASEEEAALIVDLDAALTKLASENEEQSSIVEMKFFGGLTSAEIAEAMKISKRSVVRKWQAAKMWLLREMRSD